LAEGALPDLCIRFYQDGDRTQVESFECLPRRGKLSYRPARDAQDVIRDSPSSLDDESLKPEIIVATIGLEVVGVAVFGPDETSDTQFWIFSIGVKPRWQRQQIGTRLKKSVMAECRSRGASAIIQSKVNKYNSPMRNLNEKLGVEATPDPTDGKMFYSVVLVELTDVVDPAWRPRAD